MLRHHRTQLLLEPEQYERLRQISETTGRSISATLREILDRYLSRPSRRGTRSLAAIKGLGSGHRLSGRDHDSLLYDQR